MFAKAPTTNPAKINIDITLIGFVIFFVMAGNFLANKMPVIKGIPRRIKIVRSMCPMLMSIGMMISEVFSYKFPQKAKFSGVKNNEATVAKAVKVTDSAVFPLAR